MRNKKETKKTVVKLLSKRGESKLLLEINGAISSSIILR